MMKKSQEQVAFARELRQKQTDAERILWLKLKNKQVDGVKFRRQQPVGVYTPDFVSFERSLSLKLMGDSIMSKRWWGGMRRGQRR